MIEWFKQLFDDKRLREMELNTSLITMMEGVIRMSSHKETPVIDLIMLNERLVRLRHRNKILETRLSVKGQAVLLQKKLSNES